MTRKPVIAILADFPLPYVRPEVPQAGWHCAVWLVAMYEAFAAQQEYEIHWVTFSKEIRHDMLFDSGGQHFHALRARSLTLAERTGFFFERRRIRRELRAIRPDVVHVWGTEGRYAPCALGLGVCTLMSMQGVLSAIRRRSPLSGYERRRAAWEERYLKRFPVITAESEWACERCREVAPASRIRRWEYAPESFFFQAERCPADHPMCLMAGTDTPLKDVDSAIAAFSAPELADVRLCLAGVAPEQRPHLPPNIVALGAVPHRRMADLLAETWCLIHPSLADSSPNIIKEARVMGVPVVTTTECGGKQYVEQGASGYIIAPRDVPALVRAVRAVCASRERSLQMGEHGRTACRQRLSASTMMAELRQIYSELLS